MGIKDKIVNKAAEQMMQKTGESAARVLESIHAHLEKQLETQRLILQELRQMNKKPEIKFEDEKQ